MASSDNAETTAKKLNASSYQRLPIKLLNGALRSAQSFGLARFTLDTQKLLKKACKDTGLRDFGDDRFMTQLQLLVEDTNRTALNPLGRFMARSNIERLLQGRLEAEALWQRHPEILERSLPDPVVIVGLARSGTTRLHRLLASDDRFLHLQSWESVYPVPRADSFAARAAGKTDPRITQLDQALKAVLYMSPQIGAVHPLGTHEVEEEIGLLQYAFSTQLFEVINDLPQFAEWLMTHDQKFAYEYMVKLLKTVSWFRGDPQDKPWILKSPQHMQDLDAMLHVFPNARLICPHRDPIKVVGSCCSMAWNSLVRDVDTIDPHAVGQNWLQKTRRMLHKNLHDRAELSTPEQQYDVLYADITANWQAALGGVYDFLQMPFSDQARTGMRQWLDSNSQHKHGAHKYHLADFGLTEEQVDDELMFYRERFNIPYETQNPHATSAATHDTPN